MSAGRESKPPSCLCVYMCARVYQCISVRCGQALGRTTKALPRAFCDFSFIRSLLHAQFSLFPYVSQAHTLPSYVLSRRGDRERKVFISLSLSLSFIYGKNGFALLSRRQIYSGQIDEICCCIRTMRAEPARRQQQFHDSTEQFTVLWLLFAVIVVGNTAVLAGLLLGKRRKSRMDFFIKQLALADLLVGLISVLTDIVWRTTIAWHAGNVACKLIRFSQVVVTYSSTYVLVALSIDRYDAITRPMSFSGSWWRARALVAVAWGLSVFFSTPIIFLYEERLIQDKVQCWIDLGTPVLWRIYMSLVSLTLFIAPTIIIGGCYMVIVATIWSQGGALRQGPTRETRRASSRGLIPRAKIKTVKMTFVIVFVFVICWSPYIVFSLLQVYGHIPTTQTNIAVATFIQSLAPLNSAANPIIYCLFGTQFCKNVRNMQAVSWVTGWCHSNPHNCFGTGGTNNSTRTTTLTTSMTGHSSRKRVMVSRV